MSDVEDEQSSVADSSSGSAEFTTARRKRDGGDDDGEDLASKNFASVFADILQEKVCSSICTPQTTFAPPDHFCVTGVLFASLSFVFVLCFDDVNNVSIGLDLGK